MEGETRILSSTLSPVFIVCVSVTVIESSLLM